MIRGCPRCLAVCLWLCRAASRGVGIALLAASSASAMGSGDRQNASATPVIADITRCALSDDNLRVLIDYRLPDDKKYDVSLSVAPDGETWRTPKAVRGGLKGVSGAGHLEWDYGQEVQAAPRPRCEVRAVLVGSSGPVWTRLTTTCAAGAGASLAWFGYERAKAITEYDKYVAATTSAAAAALRQSTQTARNRRNAAAIVAGGLGGCVAVSLLKNTLGSRARAAAPETRTPARGLFLVVGFGARPGGFAFFVTTRFPGR